MRKFLCMIGLHFYTDWHYLKYVRLFNEEVLLEEDADKRVPVGTYHVYKGTCDCCGIVKYRRES